MKRSRKIKKTDSTSKLILEEVIGLTTKNANGLASTVSNSKCAYVAGCVVVVYDMESCTQSHLVVSNRMPKPLSCVAVSRDANFFAVGESGYQPAILLWKASTQSLLGELKGHQDGVACIAFSPDGKRLASVGYAHDGYLCLWEMRTQTILTRIKVCSSVASVSFSLDAKFIITAGRKHLKLWTVDVPTRYCPKTRAMSINGKPLNVGHYKGCSFIAVTYPHWTNKQLVDSTPDSESSPIYALADTGILCLLSSGLTITKSVDLKVKKGLALSASSRLVACACNNGIVKLFAVSSLQYTGTLHFTSAKGCNKATTVDFHANMNQSKVQPVPTSPDAVACQFSTSEKLVVIYDDRSLSVWNLDDVIKVSRCCVLVSHSGCIWDIQNLPCENMHDPSLTCVSKGCPGGISFATCSADGSIRLWDLAMQPNLSEYDNSTDTEPGHAKYLVSAGIFARDSVASDILSPGFRSMAVSSDGKYLAAGDCLGNVHIFDLVSSNYVCIQDAHDAEIMSLSFSLGSNKNIVCDKVTEGHYFLASGGQDRMIHIYDVERSFDLIGSIDDHSDAVSSIKFIGNGCKIISCNSNRYLMLHNLAMSEMELKISPGHQIASQGTVHDIDIDPSAENALIVGEDTKINTLDVSSGKLVRSIRHDEDLGYPIKVILDPSWSFVVCSFSNGSICMYDYLTGEMAARAAGHEGAITGFIFLPDCKHLVSVGSDGCIFVWKLPGHLSTRMLLRMEKKSCPSALEIITGPVTSCQLDDNRCQFVSENLTGKRTTKEATQRHIYQDRHAQENSAFKFSISRLPKWAQEKVVPPGSLTADRTSSTRWTTKSSSSIICEEDDCIASPVYKSPSRDGNKGSQQLSLSMSRNSSDADNSQGSPKRQRNYSPFALDNRWSTIHTVCMDILSTPEALAIKDQTATHFALNNLSTNRELETTNSMKDTVVSDVDQTVKNPSKESSSDLAKHTREENVVLSKHLISESSDTLCNRVDQFSSLHKEDVANQASANVQLAASEREVSLTLVASASNVEFQDKDELQCSHSPKNLQTEVRKSSARKRQLGQFVVRMDLCDEKKFEMSNLNSTLEDASTRLPEVLHETDIGLEDAKNAKANRKAAALFGTDQTNTKKSVEQSCPGDHEFQRHEDKVIACKSALLELDAAADNALKLFSHLADVNSRDQFSLEPEIQLYAEATDMLSPIAKKLQAIARLVQSASNNISSLEKH